MAKAEIILSTNLLPLNSTQRERVRTVIHEVQGKLGYRMPSIEQYPRSKQDALEEIWLGKALDVLGEERRKLSGLFGLLRHQNFSRLQQLDYDELLVRRRLEELAPGSYSHV